MTVYSVKKVCAPCGRKIIFGKKISCVSINAKTDDLIIKFLLQKFNSAGFTFLRPLGTPGGGPCKERDFFEKKCMRIIYLTEKNQNKLSRAEKNKAEFENLLLKGRI